MEKRNSIQFKIYGEYALFSEPVTRVGGEKSSYHIPTYEALKGITEGIYWKPTLEWYIDKVRIMKPIQTQTKSIKLRKNIPTQNDLAMFTYLNKVEYQVSAHFEWNEAREDLSADRDEHKHHNLARRYLKKGGKRDVFLGTRECVAYVEPCVFGEDEGYYDNINELSFGNMFHSFTYPKMNQEEVLYANFGSIKMERGIVNFLRPEQCSVRRRVRNYSYDLITSSPERDKYEEEVLNELDNITE